MATPRVCTFISGRTFISGLVLTLLAVGLTASPTALAAGAADPDVLDLLTGAEIDLLTGDR
jgi:hypothetical protein